MRDEFDHKGFHCTRFWGEESNSGTLFCRVHAVKHVEDAESIVFDSEARFGEEYVAGELKKNNPLAYIKEYVTGEAMRKIDYQEYKNWKEERMLR
ncbi:MAG TPA: hypothetical protein PKV72_02790 [Candidatus Peribacteria bacterium]|nr:hypothetical protein [Candidatus Peribacteria bacterium]